jgi:uncharacterized membrane protein YcaP (DUF421 family)
VSFHLPNFLFAGWLPLLRIVIVGTGSYLFLLLSLRAVGPRVLAKTNIFDFIIAVGVGSAFGRVLTAKEVALSEACTAFALLVSLQYVVSKLRYRYKAVAKVTDSEPALLYFNGRFCPKTLASARLTSDDLYEETRIRGIGSMAEVGAIILEASGEVAVIRNGARSQETLGLKKPA